MTYYDYQYGFSEAHPDTVYDVQEKEQKAKKILSVLDDYYSGELDKLSLLDIGCSAGIISHVLSKRFRRVIGIDIDEPSVKFAKKNYHSNKVQFSIQDGISLGFPEHSFDVVLCAHVYEHVPDSSLLLAEIHRVLKPDGICYLAAGNRLKLIEPHYKLPLLSVIPKPLANLYLRVLKRGDFYYEKLLTLWKLQALVYQFEVIDYTLEIIENPHRYYATEMVGHGSLKQKIATWVSRTAYWLCPTYIWLLRKHKDGRKKQDNSS